MDQDRLAKAKKIVERLFKLPQEQRKPALEKLRAEHPDLYSSVDSILSASKEGKSRGAAKAGTTGGYEPMVAGYEIVGRLGAGGMGVVWEAVQLSTRRRVALKLLSESSLGSERQRSRFVREVELAASLEHPNIARVYDSGLEKDGYYYAMELVKGPALDEYVKRENFSTNQILQLMQLVCRGMQFAHERGVVHRDLKPTNILVDKNGQPRILDFGLAKLLDSEEGLALSVDGDAAGTPMFMSPEQAAGKHKETDARTDIYSMGVILYRLLVGQGPHDLSGTRFEVVRRIIEEDIRSPRDLGATIDADLEGLLFKCLAQRPEERYASARELDVDIDNYLNGRPLIARKATALYLLRKRLMRNKRGAIAAASGAVLVGIIVMGVLPGGWLREMLGAIHIVNIPQPPVLKEVVVTRQVPTTQPAPIIKEVIVTKEVPATQPVTRTPNSPELEATLKISQLETAVQKRAWSDATVLLKELKSTYAETKAVRDATDTLAKCDAAVGDAARAESDAAGQLTRAASYVGNGRYFQAKLILQLLGSEPYARTQAIAAAAEEIRSLQEKVDAHIDARDIEDRGQYVLYKNLQNPAFRSAIDSARKNAERSKANRVRNNPKADTRLEGATVYQIFLEDPKSDGLIEVSTDSPLRVAAGGGYSFSSQIKHGDFVTILGDYQLGPANGNLKIGTLHHVQISTPLSVLADDLSIGGEIMLRKTPPEQAGELRLIVHPEPGVDLTKSKLFLGRVFPRFAIGAINLSGEARFSGLTPASYKAAISGAGYRAVAGDVQSDTLDVQIDPHDTTTLELSAFAVRKISFEYWFRTSPSAAWTHDKEVLNSGDYYQPNHLNVHYPIVDISPWSAQGCKLSSINWDLSRIPRFVGPASVQFQRNPNRSGDLTASVGDAFAIFDGRTNRPGQQMIIRITDITATQPGVQAVQAKSPVSAPAEEPGAAVISNGRIK